MNKMSRNEQVAANLEKMTPSAETSGVTVRFVMIISLQI